MVPVARAAVVELARDAPPSRSHEARHWKSICPGPSTVVSIQLSPLSPGAPLRASCAASAASAESSAAHGQSAPVAKASCGMLTAALLRKALSPVCLLPAR